MGRKRVASAALAALLLAGGAVACGSEKKSDRAGEDISPAAAVKKAAKNSEELTSFSFRMKGLLPGEGKVRGEASMATEPLAVSMNMSTPEGPEKLEIRVVGDGVYLGGGKAAAEADGKRWIKFDAKTMGKGAPNKPAPSSATATAEQNPAAQSTLFTGSDDLKKVGEETVDGAETTHYRGTVTLDQMRASIDKKDAKTRERQEKGLKQYEDMGIDKLTMDMWIDGENHTKQFRTQGDADKGKFDMTITFFDVNKPVKVTAPPKNEVMDLAEMMKEMESGSDEGTS
ncbi:putative lipoprotein [Streptomyces longispororuber]|uniref:Lipoprotein n=2 Tax=Streptomyces longispororuber TaxID=68230 RepID=A0A918ZBQ8_9ACTN|nr:putative lipoprotein [Streptomyces longispororuber]